MAEKYKNGAMDRLFGSLSSKNKDNINEESDRPSHNENIVSNRSKKKESYQKITTRIELDLMNKVRAIADKYNVQLGEVINSCLRSAISNYEEKNGEIKPIRKKQHGSLDGII